MTETDMEIDSETTELDDNTKFLLNAKVNTSNKFENVDLDSQTNEVAEPVKIADIIASGETIVTEIVNIKCSLKTIIKKLAELFFKPYFPEEETYDNYQYNKMTIFNKLKNPQTKQTWTSNIQISDVFKLIFQFISVLPSSGNYEFFKDLLACTTDPIKLSHFIIKYGKGFEPEELQDLLIIIQALNGTLTLTNSYKPTVDFAKSLTGTVRIRGNFENIFRTYIIFPENIKSMNCKTYASEIKKELIKIFKTKNLMGTTKKVEQYRVFTEAIFESKQSLLLSNLIRQTQMKSLLFIELANGLLNKTRNTFANIDCSSNTNKFL